MNSTTLLRIAFVVVMIQYLAHAILFLRAKPSHGKEETELVEAMKRNRWNFGGFQRSYWNFYFGYGLLVILWGLAEAAIIWQMVTLSKTSSVEIKPLIAILFFVNIIHAILTLKYFFITPVIFDCIVAILLAIAFVFT